MIDLIKEPYKYFNCFQSIYYMSGLIKDPYNPQISEFVEKAVDEINPTTCCGSRAVDELDWFNEEKVGITFLFSKEKLTKDAFDLKGVRVFHYPIADDKHLYISMLIDEDIRSLNWKKAYDPRAREFVHGHRNVRRSYDWVHGLYELGLTYSYFKRGGWDTGTISFLDLLTEKSIEKPRVSITINEQALTHDQVDGKLLSLGARKWQAPIKAINENYRTYGPRLLLNIYHNQPVNIEEIK